MLLIVKTLFTFGQPSSKISSNLRTKKISTKANVQIVDSLSIVPGTFIVENVTVDFYEINEVDAIIRWNKQILQDSVFVSYRVFDFKWNSVSRRLNYEDVRNNFLAGNPTKNRLVKNSNQNSLFDFGNLQSSGSIGRSFSFGNNRDANVNSSMNFQLNGYLGDSLQLMAAISDNNMPIQPEGNTANLNDFDRILIQLKKDNWALNLGDIDTKQDQLEFLTFNKRIQGASYSNRFTISPSMSIQSLLSGAVTRGKFSRNNIIPIEGNQGPYRLQGANNELYFIVIAASERVFIDGMMMQRGQDQDYVIDYNTAEIRFTPKNMITKDKRIQVEFEYTDRNYINSQWYSTNTINIGKKSSIGLSVYTNTDAKNSFIDQKLSPSQIAFLATLGDSVQQAYISNARVDTFYTGKILYKKIDTVYNGILRDSIYVQSNDESQILYSLQFSYVGQGKGNYKIIQNAANGKVYAWVAPGLDNNKNGDWEPVTFITTPKSISVYDLSFSYKADSNFMLGGEFALSNNDVNLYANKQKKNDVGYSGKLSLAAKSNSVRILNNEQSISGAITIQGVNKNFRTVQRLRSVEFYRDWSLPILLNQVANEWLSKSSIAIKGSKNNQLSYEYSSFTRDNAYKGSKHVVTQQLKLKTWQYSGTMSALIFDATERKGVFLRPNVSASKYFPALKNIRGSVYYFADNNKVSVKKADTLSLESFVFSQYGATIKSDSTLLNKWSLGYFSRQDKLPYENKLLKADQSHNYVATLDLLKNENRQLNINLGYRTLTIIRENISNSKADKTITGRAEYNCKEWNGLLNGNVLYETGGGREQKKDYAYVPVPVGQGQYTWIDYNNNGIEELNEFEIAVFQDQKKYIRVYTPTNEFQRANYVQLNYTIDIHPENYFLTKNKWSSKLLSRLQLVSTMQLFRKVVANQSIFINPLQLKIDDTALITNNSYYSNSLYINRNNSKWGLDILQNYSAVKSFLSYGIENNVNTNYKSRLRINFSRTWLGNLDATLSEKKLQSNGFSFNNRNYLINQSAFEPSISYVYKAVFRGTIAVGFTNAVNRLDSMEKAQTFSFTGRLKYNLFNKSTIDAKLTLNKISFDAYSGAANTTVGFLMLEGLQPGKNAVWTIDITHRLMKNVEMNLQYEGRKAGVSNVVNIGRAGIRALL